MTAERESHEHPMPDLQADLPSDHQGACVRDIHSCCFVLGPDHY